MYVIPGQEFDSYCIKEGWQPQELELRVISVIMIWQTRLNRLIMIIRKWYFLEIL